MKQDMSIHPLNENGEYNKRLTEDIAKKLGPFRYDPLVADSVRREKRHETTLENGAVYVGDWNTDTNERDGRGS